jgi:hypothetical protein
MCQGKMLVGRTQQNEQATQIINYAIGWPKTNASRHHYKAEQTCTLMKGGWGSQNFLVQAKLSLNNQISA